MGANAGYLPSSGGLPTLEARLAAGAVSSDALDALRASSSGGKVFSQGAHADAAEAAGVRNGAAAAPDGSGADGRSRRWWRHADGKVRMQSHVECGMLPVKQISRRHMRRPLPDWGARCAGAAPLMHQGHCVVG